MKEVAIPRQDTNTNIMALISGHKVLEINLNLQPPKDTSLLFYINSILLNLVELIVARMSVNPVYMRETHKSRDSPFQYRYPSPLPGGFFASGTSKDHWNSAGLEAQPWLSTIVHLEYPRPPPFDRLALCETSVFPSVSPTCTER